MKPVSVLEGKFDECIKFQGKNNSPNPLLDHVRVHAPKDLTAELVYAVMRRREILDTEKEGNGFAHRINTSLQDLTIPVDLWTQPGETNSNLLKWLLVRGAHVPYSTWEQWGMAGGQRVRVLVNVVSELQSANNSFLHNENVGWLWGHLLQGLLVGDMCPPTATNTAACNGSACLGGKCACRSCLASYIVEAGVAHEAGWCEVRKNERERTRP